GDFIEWIHRHLDVGEFHARSIALDKDLDVEIDHPLYRHQNLHRPSFAWISGLISLGAEPKGPANPGQRAKAKNRFRTGAISGSGRAPRARRRRRFGSRNGWR